MKLRRLSEGLNAEIVFAIYTQILLELHILVQA